MFLTKFLSIFVAPFFDSVREYVQERERLSKEQALAILRQDKERLENEILEILRAQKIRSTVRDGAPVIRSWVQRSIDSRKD